MKSKLITFLLILTIFSILYCQQNVTEAIRNSILLFQKNIFPSLFPFLVLSPFFIQYGLFDFIKKFLGPIVKKFFRISENSAYLFFMSMISGFPSSATYAKNLYEKNCITKEEAFHTLLFSHFSNPLFLFSLISCNPLLVLFSHYISNFIIGFFLRYHKKERNSTPLSSEEKIAFFGLFSHSIQTAMNQSLFIFGVITFFFMINAILDFPIMHLTLELSQALHYLNELSLSDKFTASLSAFLLSFGGFSVHIQVYGILQDWHIPYLPYLCTRICHGIVSFSIVYLLF